MTRLCYDSTTAGDIPPTAQMVAGYCDGLYRWSSTDWLRFPSAVKVRIAVNPNTNDGHVGDVEQGDMTPTTALGWVMRRRAAGVDPTLYATWGTISEIAQVFNGAGVREPHYWVAQYDNDGTLPAGVVAKQYANEPLTGGHYDLSVVADHWPGVDQEDEVLDANDPIVQQILGRLSEIDNRVDYCLSMLTWGDTAHAGGQPTDPRWLFSELDDTHNKVTEVWDLLRLGKHADGNPNFIGDTLNAIKADVTATAPATPNHPLTITLTGTAQ